MLKKILLIQPPIQDFYDTDVRLQPIGLSYLKSSLNQNFSDLQVLIRDYHHGHGRFTVPLPHELNYLKRYWLRPDESPFCGFNNYYHFGLSFEKILEDIKNINPDLIGISALFSPYFREVTKITELIKSWKDIPIVLGGSHVNAMPTESLSVETVDFIIKGEGERGIVELVKYLRGLATEDDVSGLGYKKNGELVINNTKENYPIESLPVPDLSDFPKDMYTVFGKPMCFLITSRSCPHKCSFCSVHLTFGHNYRRRSVDCILSEIKLRYSQGYKVIDFEDDNLTFFKKEMKELCRKISLEIPKGELEFVAMNGISYLSLDNELLELMKEAGFTHLNLALVSSDKAVRESTKRPHTLEKYLEIVNTAHCLGFKIVSYQILGLPSESLPSQIQTLKTNASLPVLMGASMFYLTPNSPIAKSFKPSTEKDIFCSRLSAMYIESNFFERDDIYTLFILTRILDFIKSFEITDDTNLSNLVFYQKNDLNSSFSKRFELGMEILQKLFSESIFYQKNKIGFFKNIAFKIETFLLAWSEIDVIVTQNGFKVFNDLKKFQFIDTVSVLDSKIVSSNLEVLI